MLSKAQRNVLAGILAYRRLTGVSPTNRELAALCEVNHSTIWSHLRRLEDRGLISRRNKHPRSIVPRAGLTFDSTGNVYEVVHVFE